jgi:hypothetical protein
LCSSPPWSFSPVSSSSRGSERPTEGRPAPSKRPPVARCASHLASGAERPVRSRGQGCVNAISGLGRAGGLLAGQANGIGAGQSGVERRSNPRRLAGSARRGRAGGPDRAPQRRLPLSGPPGAESARGVAGPGGRSPNERG